MGRYAAEPDNATKAAKAKGSNLRVHFKVRNEFFILVLVTANYCVFCISSYLFVLFDIFHMELKEGDIWECGV